MCNANTESFTHFTATEWHIARTCQLNGMASVYLVNDLLCDRPIGMRSVQLKHYIAWFFFVVVCCCCCCLFMFDGLFFYWHQKWPIFNSDICIQWPNRMRLHKKAFLSAWISYKFSNSVNFLCTRPKYASMSGHHQMKRFHENMTKKHETHT